MLNHLKKKVIIYCLLALSWISAYFFLQFLQFEITISPEEMELVRFKIVVMGIVMSLIWEEIYQLIKKHSRRLSSFFLFVVSFSIVGSIVILGTYLLVEELEGWMFSRNQFSRNIEFYRTKPFLIVLVYSYCVMFGINFLREIDQKMGRGNLLKFIVGRYYIPHERQRIFLFMDLKSSTFYAEQLGHFRYSRLLQDCFHDLTEVVVKNDAEIYQYIGDEVVITWDINKGFIDSRCLKLYFDFHEKLEMKGEAYLKKYGLIPYFKAGIHSGKVTVAEVGDLKRVIAYHGDAINTASRIQGLCNEYKAGCLISEDVLKELETTKGYEMVALGKRQLRGKKDLLDIYSVVPATN